MAIKSTISKARDVIPTNYQLEIWQRRGEKKNLSKIKKTKIYNQRADTFLIFSKANTWYQEVLHSITFTLNQKTTINKSRWIFFFLIKKKKKKKKKRNLFQIAGWRKWRTEKSVGSSASYSGQTTVTKFFFQKGWRLGFFGFFKVTLIPHPLEKFLLILLELPSLTIYL